MSHLWGGWFTTEISNSQSNLQKPNWLTWHFVNRPLRLGYIGVQLGKRKWLCLWASSRCFPRTIDKSPSVVLDATVIPKTAGGHAAGMWELQHCIHTSLPSFCSWANHPLLVIVFMTYFMDTEQCSCNLEFTSHGNNGDAIWPVLLLVFSLY